MRTVRFRQGGPAGLPGPTAIVARALQPWVDRLVAALAARHGGLLDRLSMFKNASLRLEPSDLPFAVLVSFGAAGVRAQIIGGQDAPAARAVIRAPLHVLLDIAEGRIDGDGMFFARAVSVTGDTSLIVALRNALDDAEIDLAAAAAEACGPLAAALRPALAVGREVAAGLSRLASREPAAMVARHG